MSRYAMLATAVFAIAYWALDQGLVASTLGSTAALALVLVLMPGGE